MPSEAYSISVVIPSYNRGEVVGRAIESTLAQTLPLEEVIVVDDGSTDGTSEWLRSTYPNIKLIEQENKGVSAARNVGIRAARTEWVALLDSDDVWLPQKVEKQVKALQNTPGFRICHTEEKWIYKGKERPVAPAYRKQGGWIFEACLLVCAISPSTVLISRDLFEEVGLFDESFPVCEDYDLWLRITAIEKVLLVDEPLIEKHGGHGDQLSDRRGMDRYRIEALKKALGSNCLTTTQEAAARQVFQQKCELYAVGAEKRGRIEEAKRYREMGLEI